MAEIKGGLMIQRFPGESFTIREAGTEQSATFTYIGPHNGVRAIVESSTGKVFNLAPGESIVVATNPRTVIMCDWVDTACAQLRVKAPRNIVIRRNEIP